MTSVSYTHLQRDLRNNQLLSEQGWNVIVIWECQLKKSTFDETMQHLVEQIKNPPQPE